ncbi:VP1 [Gokushovirus WZ-2015a]|nr:VP1 [Gokushovirus WZ-2015a]
MNRNSNFDFSRNPGVSLSRSRFNRTSDRLDTFDTGEIVPIYVDEVLPGDTFELDMTAIIRGSTPIFPVMDNSYLDVYFFFVPNRLTWEHWRELMGENRTTAWTQKVDYSVPQVTAPAGGWAELSLADHFGIPTKVDNISVNALPFRAYGLIYNEFFRNQNLTNPTQVEVNDANITGKNPDDVTNSNDWAITGAKCLKSAKFFDYFTGALPQPQKGEPVEIGATGGVPLAVYSDAKLTNLYPIDNNAQNEKWILGDTGIVSQWKIPNEYNQEAWSTRVKNNQNNKNGYLGANLGNAFAISVNQLRQAFQVQKLLEKDARGGTRYREILKNHFGVTTSDARMQIPEYLGGCKVPINVSQVVQTSASTDASPQGNTAAISVTPFSKSMFTKSFDEHGFIIGVATARTAQSYQQGIERMWSRKDRLDYYFPVLANIGEQAILNKEIYAQGNAKDDEAFGYQEAWADYRYKPNTICGRFRSNAQQSLDAWHYGQDYDKLPTLSTDWMQQSDTEMKRTLAVQTEPDFIANFRFNCKTVRVMPLYSIPGLIDHN